MINNLLRLFKLLSDRIFYSEFVIRLTTLVFIKNIFYIFVRTNIRKNINFYSFIVYKIFLLVVHISIFL